VVTTTIARVSAFARTHLQAVWFAYARAFTVISERMIKRYRSD